MLSIKVLICLVLEVLGSKLKSRVEFTDVMCPEILTNCSTVSFWCTNIARIVNKIDDTCCCDSSVVTYSIVIPKTLEEIVNPIRNDVTLVDKTLEDNNIKYYVNIFCPKLVSACSKAVLTCPNIHDYYYNANDDYCCCIPDLKPTLRLRNSTDLSSKSKRSISDVYCPDVVRGCSSFWFSCTQTDVIRSEGEDTCCCDDNLLH